MLLVSAPAGFLYAGDQGYPPGSSGMNRQWWNLSPRVGVAWDVTGDGRMSVRSSYGLAGEAIPVEARIVAVVDAFDAMTTNRAYRESFVPGSAFDELRRCAGRQFEPAIVDAFCTAFPDPARLPIHA